MNKAKSLLVVFLMCILLPLFIQQVAAASTSSTDIPNTYQNVGQPAGIVVLPDNHVWYVDGLNKRLVLVNVSTNTILRTVGREGSNEGEFDWGIRAITRDSEGNLYVLSQGCMVHKLDANGGFIASYDLQTIPNSMCAEPGGFTYDAFTNTLLVANTTGNTVTRFTLDLVPLGHFGSEGDGAGQFRGPWNLATDPGNGRIYVTDEWHTGGGRVQIFNSNFSVYGPLPEISSWADEGGGTTGFVAVKSVVILPDGNIAVTSQNAPRIELFDAAGNHLRSITGGVAHMYGPTYITSDSSNTIYVNDYMLTGVYKYSEAGVLQEYFPTNPPFVPGNLSSPTDSAFTDHSTIFAVDHGLAGVSRVQEFSLAGTYIKTIIEPGIVPDASYIAFGPDGDLFVQSTCGVNAFVESGGNWTLDYQIGNGCGSGDGEFNMASQFVFDSAGNIYIGDFNNSRVQKFSASTGYDYERQFVNSGAYPNEYAVGVAVAADGTVYCSDYETVHIFNSAGVQTGTWGTRYTDFQIATQLYIDGDGNIYLTDGYSYTIHKYNSSWVWLEDIGSRGGNQMQFASPIAVKIDSATNAMAIADQNNGRVLVTKTGTRILGLIPSADVIRIDTGESLANKAWDPGAEDLSNIPARLIFGEYVVAEFNVDLTQDRDWSHVNVLTLPNSSKSLVVNLRPGAGFAPGISATHSLYVYRYANQHSVTVCPDANSWGGVVEGCSNSYIINEGGADLTALTLNGKNYWRIDNLSGTGAFSTLFQTSFQLRDLMTRQKISVGSDHRLSFGTTYDINHDGDTITVGFGPEWDFTSLVLGDITLLRSATVLTLDTVPDTDTWGVTWVANQLVFTAPTNTGSTEGINGGVPITVVINNAHILNPPVVESYLINLVMVSSDGLGGENIETGNVNVPIVDDDQVNITGFINTFIYFDLDTNTDGSECAYNTCPLYTGAGAADNYTIDLGELNAIWVNKSQDAVFTHSDSGTGTINSIYMELTTNAYNGAVVKVSSANGGLQGPGTNMIAAVTSGDNIVANSGSYGFTMPDLNTTANGTIVRNALCSTATTYCGLTTGQVEVFNTASAPLDTGHIRMDLGAAASYMNNPGTYTDTLTFVAVGNF